MTYNFGSLEEINNSSLSFTEKAKARLQFTAGLALSNRLNTPKNTTQDAINKQLKSTFAENQYYGIKALNDKLSSELIANQTPVKKTHIKPINANIANYLTVGRDRQISGIVNEFLSVYIKSGAKDFDSAWKDYSHNAPRIKDDPYTTGLKVTAKQTIDMLNKRYKDSREPIKGFKYSGNIAGVQFNKKDNLPVNLNAMYNADKSQAMLFTGRATTETSLSKSAEKIFATYKKLNTISYITPKGIIKFSNTAGSEIINGPTSETFTKPNVIKLAAAKHVQSNGGGFNYSSLDAHVNSYNKHQAKIDRLATIQVEKLVGIAVKSLGTGDSSQQVNNILDKNVKDFKNYGSQFDEFKNLQGWTTSDNLTVRDVISSGSGLHAQKGIEAQERKNVGTRRRAALSKAYTLAKELGIDKSVISKQTIDYLIGGKTNTNTFDKSVGAINSYLTDSKLQMKTIYAGKDLRREFPLRNKWLEDYAKKPNQALDFLFKNMSDKDILYKMGMLEESVVNPILNTKGKVQERFMKHAASAVMDRRNAPNIKIAGEFLNLLADRKLSNTEQVFETAHDNRDWKSYNVTEDTRSNIKMKAMDALYDFSDSLDSRAEERSGDKNLKNYEAAKLDYVNSKKIDAGEEFSLDSTKKVITPLSGIQSSENNQLLEQIEAKLLKDGFEGSPTELLTAIKDRASLEAVGGSGQYIDKLTMNEELFASKDGVKNKFRLLQERRTKGLLKVSEHEMLNNSFFAYNGFKAKNDREMLLGLAGLEFDYLGSKPSGATNNAWVTTSNYLKSASMYGAGQAMIQDYLDLGLLDMKKMHNYGFQPGKTNATKPQSAYKQDTKIINYEKLTNKNQSFLVRDTDAHIEITNGLRDYLDPSKHKGEIHKGQLAVFAKLSNNQALITERERGIFKALDKDKKAEIEHNKLMDAGDTFDSYKSKIDRKTVIESLSASQGIGKEQYGKIKPSEFDASPIKVRLTQRMAANLNESKAVLSFATDSKFRNTIESLATGDANDSMIYGEKGLDSKAQTLGYMFSKVDTSNLPLDIKAKIKLVGNELFTKYDDAYGKSPMNSLVFSKALDTYVKDTSIMLRPRYEGNDSKTKNKLKMLDSRYEKGSSGNIAIDKYYTPTIKTLINSASNSYDSIVNRDKEYKFNQEVTEDHKKAYALKANSELTKTYGSTFQTGMAASDAAMLDYDTTRAKRTTRTFANRLESTKGKTFGTKAPVEGQKKSIKIPFFRGLSGFAVRTRKPQKLDLFSKFPLDPKFGVLKLAKGGKIPGDGHRDEVPALLTKGEVVLDKYTSKDLGIHSQKDYERFKTAVKHNRVSYFATGDYVDEFGNPINPEDALKKRLGKSVDIDNLETGKVKPQSSSGITEVNIDATTRAQIDADMTNSSDVPNKKRKLNSALRDMPISQIDGARLQGQLDARGLVDTETKNIQNNTKVGLDPEMSINQHIDAGNILSANQSKTLQTLPMSAVQKDKIKRLTETAQAKTIGRIALSSVETLNNDLKNVKTSTFYNSVMKNPGTIVNPKLKETFKMAQANMAKALLPDIDNIKAEMLGGANTLGGYSTSSQDSINKLKNVPEKFEAFKNVASPDMLKSFSIDTSVSNLDKSIKMIGTNIGDLNKLFKTNFKAPQNKSDMTNIVDKLNKAKTGYTYSGRVDNAADMNKMQRFMTVLGDTIDESDVGGLDRKNKLNEMNKQVGSAKHLKESSKMRWSNFGDLMVQNAAFGASYAVIGGATAAIAGGVGFVTGLDERLHNLQAITGATGHELDQMAGSVKLVSTETKFSANEIADAATILGQAGFNAQDIKQSLGGVVKLATATGSALEDATQTLTSALTIWDAPMRDSVKYADQFTAAINQSKLDVKSLSLALQYTGNIAAQGGIPVEDVVTLTSLMKDSGIKQGSTVGTGQRLVTSDILAPSSKFTKALSSVGITKRTMADTFDDGGVLKVLKLMRDEGFGFGQATRGMEVRERSAYMAMINQIDKAPLFRANMMVPGSADVANETQMKSFNNRLKNMVNSWGIGLDEMVNQRTTTIGNMLEALTYSPGTNKDHPFDTKTNVYDQISTPENQSGLGDPLALGIAAGAAGFGTYKGYKTYLANDKKGKRDIRNRVDPRNIGLKRNNKPVFNALDRKNIPKGLLPIAGISLAAQAAFSDDPWYATVAKEAPSLAVGLGAAAAGTVASGMNPIAGYAAGAAGTMAFEGLVGDAWNNFIDSSLGLKSPDQLDLLENVNTRYSAAASTTNDLSKYSFQLRDPRSHLRYSDKATESEKSLSTLATKGQGRILNEQFKSDIDFVAKETGVKFDFSMVRGTKDKQIADVMADKVDEFQDEFTRVIFDRAENMLDHLKQASGKDKKFTTETLDQTINQVSSEFRSVITDMAEARPEVLMAKLEELTAVRKKLSKDSRKHIVEVDPGTKFMGRGLLTNIQNTSIDDKETQDLEAMRQTLLTVHDSARNLKALDAIMVKTEQRIKSGDVRPDEVDDLREAQDGKRVRLTKKTSRLDRWESKLAELEADVATVDESYNKFFKIMSKTSGKEIVNLSRLSGQANITAAINISKAFDGLGQAQKQAGEDSITGKNRGYYTYKYKSATDEDIEVGALEPFAKNMGQDFTGSLDKNKDIFATMQLNAIALAENSVKDFNIPIQKANITDPTQMRNYIARDRKFEDLGFITGMFEKFEDMGIANMSVTDALTGPLADISSLMQNMNPVYQRQQEISEVFKLKAIDIQHAKIVNMRIGEGEGPFNAETSELGRSQDKRQKAYGIAVSAEGRQVDFAMQKASDNFVRQMDKFEDNMDFQRENMEISYSNQQAAMARQYQFKVDLAGIQYGYKLTDISMQTGYKREDLTTKTDRAIEDLNTSISRKLDDTNKNFGRQIKAINLGFSRQIDSIERARQDTIDFFDRSMDRPTNIKLNPEAFMKIAEVMNDNTLAIDSHKATLAMNTTAIDQLIAIQTSKEDIVKEAYKYAYKGVGGEVYSDDGSINKDFTKMYDDYLAKNNEQLLDSVLDNAISTTFSGGGFDVNQALTDSSYIAAQVLDPSAPVTTEGLVEGSGYTTEELVNALVGPSTGEINLTTTQGVVLNAQGDLAGAIFDLETQMMKYDIQLRDAGISFSNSLIDASLALSYSLEDIDLALSRGLEDIGTSLLRGMDDILTNHGRALDQAALANSRNLEMMALNYQFQLQEAAINFNQALAALVRQEAFNKEQMEQSLLDLFEDITTNSEFKLSEMVLNNDINRDLIAYQFTQLIETLDLTREGSVMAVNNAFDLALQKSYVDAVLVGDLFNRGLKRATMDKRIDMSFFIAETNRSMDSALKDMEWQWQGLATGIQTSLDKLATDTKWLKAFSDAGEGIYEIMQEALSDAGNTNLKAISDAYNKIIIKNFSDSTNEVQKAKVTIMEADAEAISKVMLGITGVSKAYLETIDLEVNALDVSEKSMNDLQVRLASYAVDSVSAIANAVQRVFDYEAILASRTYYTPMQTTTSDNTNTGMTVDDYDLSSAGYAQYASTGMVLDGYGGGDIIPAMLEPGEAIIRKETVKTLGREYFNDLNNPTAGKIISKPQDLSAGVSSLPLNGVDSNNVDNNFSIGIQVSVGASMNIEDNIEQIADGVRRVFQEYV